MKMEIKLEVDDAQIIKKCIEGMSNYRQNI